MSFCFLYNVVLENNNVQNSPLRGGGGGKGSLASSRYIVLYLELRRYRDIEMRKRQQLHGPPMLVDKTNFG